MAFGRWNSQGGSGLNKRCWHPGLDHDGEQTRTVGKTNIPSASPLDGAMTGRPTSYPAGSTPNHPQGSPASSLTIEHPNNQRNGARDLV